MTMSHFDPASPRQLPVSIGKVLKDQFADVKWHRLSKIAHKIDHDEDRVRRALDRMLKTHGCKAEKKKVGHFEYRIFRLDKTISSSELVEKLTPILKGFEAEGPVVRPLELRSSTLST